MEISWSGLLVIQRHDMFLGGERKLKNPEETVKENQNHFRIERLNVLICLHGVHLSLLWPLFHFLATNLLQSVSYAAGPSSREVYETRAPSGIAHLSDESSTQLRVRHVSGFQVWKKQRSLSSVLLQTCMEPLQLEEHYNLMRACLKCSEGCSLIRRANSRVYCTSSVVSTIFSTEEKYASQRNCVCCRRERILSWWMERIVEGICSKK